MTGIGTKGYVVDALKEEEVRLSRGFLWEGGDYILVIGK